MTKKDFYVVEEVLQLLKILLMAREKLGLLILELNIALK
jgi:hypothetical protein